MAQSQNIPLRLWKIEATHRSVATHSLITTDVKNTIAENARECLIDEIVYADDLVLMSEGMENLREKFLKWKESYKRKVNVKNSKMMVSDWKGEIIKN